MVLCANKKSMLEKFCHDLWQACNQVFSIELKLLNGIDLSLIFNFVHMSPPPPPPPPLFFFSTWYCVRIYYIPSPSELPCLLDSFAMFSTFHFLLYTVAVQIFRKKPSVARTTFNTIILAVPFVRCSSFS